MEGRGGRKAQGVAYSKKLNHRESIAFWIVYDLRSMSGTLLLAIVTNFQIEIGNIFADFCKKYIYYYVYH
jgi:hypothetical protein